MPAGWQAIALPDLPEGKALAAYASGERRVVVARLRANTDGAFEGKAAFFAGLEQGVQRDAEGYRRLAASVRKLGKRRLPGYDLWYRAGGTVHGARFIFTRTYAFVLHLELPDAQAVDKAAKRLLESFQPG